MKRSAVCVFQFITGSKIKFCLLPLIFFLSVKLIQRQDPLKCEIYDYGLYEYFEEHVPAENYKAVPNGEFNHFGMETKLLRRTKTFPAKVGTRIGFKYRITGLPKKSKSVNVSHTIRFPGFIDKNGNYFDKYSDNWESYSSDGKIEDIYGYSFDHKSELSTGVWTFSVWHKSKELCSISFEMQ